MPRIVSVPLSLEQRERLIFLAKHAKHWRERQRAQTILWLSEGKSVAEVATLQERIPETIRLQRRRWELYEFESIKEGHRSGRPNTLISDYQAKILDWVNTSPLNAEQILLEVVVISFHYMQIVEFVIDLRLLVCARDKTYNLP